MEGKRSSDPPPRQPLTWRAGLHVRRNPVMVAFALALIVASVGVWQLVELVSTFRTTQMTQIELNRDLAKIAVTNQKLVRDQAENRADAVSLLCIQNDVMVGILQKNRGARGGRDAIEALLSIDCARLVSEAERQRRRARTQPTPPIAPVPERTTP
jgi:hypothetical protein